eukprot:gene10263-18957_t
MSVDGTERPPKSADSSSSIVSNFSATSDGESSLKKVATEDIMQRRMTVMNSFRIGSSSPGSRPSTSGYRRRTPVPHLIERIVLERANELHKLASQALENEDFINALSYLNKAVVLDPENCDLYTERGEAYFQISDFQSAILNYKQACILQPDCERYFSRLAFMYYLKGQTFFDEENYEDALECFSKAIELQPNFLGFHTRSIACLAALQRHGECLALVNKRIEIEKDNADLYLMRARIHNTFRNDSLYYFDVVDALRLDPGHKEAKEMLDGIEARSKGYKSQAMRLDLMGKTDDSIVKISSAIDVDPSFAQYHVYRQIYNFFRSALLRRNHEFVAAVDDLLMAMDKTKHDEGHPVYREAQNQLLLTYNDFAVDCFTKGFYEEAIVLLNKAIKCEKSEKRLYMNRGDCFYKTKELHFALSDYLEALEIDPTNSTIKSRLAAVYNDLGILEYHERRYQQAEEFFSVAISYNPSISSYYVSRARTRYMLETHENAQIDVLSALHIDINNKEVISLFTRLFPGNTTTEALNTRLGEMVGIALTSVISDIIEDSSVEFNQSPSRTFSPKSVLPGIRKLSVNDSNELIKSCMSENEITSNVIKGKKKVNDLVESVIHSRQSLAFTGPRVKGQGLLAIELPTWADKTKLTNPTVRKDPSLSPDITKKQKHSKAKAITFLKA